MMGDLDRDCGEVSEAEEVEQPDQHHAGDEGLLANEVDDDENDGQ